MTNEPTCYGETVACSNPEAALCKKPDETKASCVLGGGDCNGYAAKDAAPVRREECDCAVGSVTGESGR